MRAVLLTALVAPYVLAAPIDAEPSVRRPTNADLVEVITTRDRGTQDQADRAAPRTPHGAPT